MGEPRSSGQLGVEFPYRFSTMCYVEVTADGTVSQGIDKTVYERARSGQSRLFAVWPGNYRSDLFVIDDLDQLARGMGWVHDEARSGLVDHEHTVRWEIDGFDQSTRGGYVGVRVWLDCGCAIRDRRAFAAQMRAQRGWDIATSTGGGSSSSSTETSYSMRVRRKSLS